ncbi:fibroblast growth factor-binding protein 1 [Ornithorhynchus anatinus]|uniref:Fibroblast growth factor binding protein 1 n=1 Tax=Ornithorhynchus anatinus TaxID=9258 RepID=F7EXB4_ORNAN|nr:fibroblast growth factor-binding protein 1 [Ornithorhynchus anatinus]
MRIRCIALFSILLLVSQLLFVEGEKQKERKNGREGKGERQQAGSPGPHEKGQKSRGGKGFPKGKFSTKDKADCTWAVTRQDSTSTLTIECKRGNSMFGCTYAGNPSSCPQFEGNEKPYWKQISRVLKKQKGICQDPESVLRSRLCKKGSSGATLKMVNSTLSKTESGAEDKSEQGGLGGIIPTVRAENGAVTKGTPDCEEDEDIINQRKVADEYCGHSWSSLCRFFLTMFQDNTC